MARCEDFPCCGHEPGCCPNYDASGRQLDKVCVCGKRLPVGTRYSICESCMNEGDEDEEDRFVDPGDDEDFDEEFDFDDGMDGDHVSGLASAGFGTDEDYGGGYDDFLGD